MLPAPGNRVAVGLGLGPASVTLDEVWGRVQDYRK